MRGTTGCLWRADVLVDMLADPGEPLHAEAQGALENLAGGRVAESAADWRAWFATMPEAVK